MLTIAAEPYPYPVPDRSQVALVIIDMQRDFMLPGGFGDALGNDVTLLQSIVPSLQTLLAAARELGMTIVHTLECHQPDLSDCPPAKRLRGNSALKIGDPGPMGRILVKGEYGNDIMAEVAPLPGEVIIHKPGKGAFYGTGLQDILQSRGITHLLITGVTTEVCVQTTMREANDRGYECLMVSDCTASYFPAFKESTLAMMTAQGGIIGWVADASTVIAGLTAA